MAIDDLIARIESDAAAEVAAIAEKSRAEADDIVGRAEAAAAADRAAVLDRARREAAAETETLLANARLAARDQLLGGKRSAAEQVLDRAQRALEELPDAEYVELIASAVAQTAVEGDALAIASADRGRLTPLDARLAELGVTVRVLPGDAPIEHGVLLTGDRVRLEVSPASLVADSREQLLLVASGELFGRKG